MGAIEHLHSGEGLVDIQGKYGEGVEGGLRERKGIPDWSQLRPSYEFIYKVSV